MPLRAPYSLLICLPLLTLAACDAPSAKNGDGMAREQPGVMNETPEPPVRNEAELAPPVADPVATAAAAPVPLACSAQIGSAAAARLVKACRNVSPATHPPCNAANSCAIIEDEIARSCALFDGKGEPMADCKVAPKSMAAAADVVRRYYSAINARDYGTAWQQWGENGAPGQSLAKFSAGFAATQSVHVTIGRMEPGDGGAGSIYQTVPVTVDAMLDTGKRQRFVGEYVVRRVNDVDGASAAQLRWHIGSARLKAG